jgi:hypothetical protein
MNRRLFAPAFLLSGLAALVLLGDGAGAQDRDRPPAEPNHRFSLLNLRGEGPRILDRATGRIYLVDLRQGLEGVIISCLDAEAATFAGKKTTFTRQPEAAATGEIPWPTRAHTEWHAHFQAIEAGGDLIVFDGDTGRLHVFESLESVTTIDPIEATVEERPLRATELAGRVAGSARMQGNEAAAIGALKTLNTSQTLFREGDKDRDDMLDYARSLKELGDTSLIDAVLASGTKQGYVFETSAAPETPEFLWMATARPVEPGKTGTRYFVTNHAGVIYYGTERPFGISADCEIPAGALPIGR